MRQVKVRHSNIWRAHIMTSDMQCLALCGCCAPDTIIDAVRRQVVAANELQQLGNALCLNVIVACIQVAGCSKPSALPLLHIMDAP